MTAGGRREGRQTHRERVALPSYPGHNHRQVRRGVQALHILPLRRRHVVVVAHDAILGGVVECGAAAAEVLLLGTRGWGMMLRSFAWALDVGLLLLGAKSCV